MRTSRPSPVTRRPSARSAFTMIEIAMSLAIIGFALVAIIGILPMGMDVQKNNRRETIINQDANFFIEAIRNGAHGLDDLTKYVAAIVVTSNGVPHYYRNTDPMFSGFPIPMGLPAAETLELTSGEIIIGLLSTPKYTASTTYKVEAYVKALSGAATEKSPQANAIINEAAFSYRMVPEIVAYNDRYYDPSWVNTTNQRVFDSLGKNLYDVRLLFRWPLLPGHEASGLPKLGNGRQVYRLMVSGELKHETAEMWFFQPQTYTP